MASVRRDGGESSCCRVESSGISRFSCTQAEQSSESRDGMGMKEGAKPVTRATRACLQYTIKKPIFPKEAALEPKLVVKERIEKRIQWKNVLISFIYTDYVKKERKKKKKEQFVFFQGV